MAHAKKGFVLLFEVAEGLSAGSPAAERFVPSSASSDSPTSTLFSVLASYDCNVRGGGRGRVDGEEGRGAREYQRFEVVLRITFADFVPILQFESKEICPYPF